MSGTNNFDKKYFLSTNWDNTNFHHFCKVRACRYSFKKSIFQKLPKIVEKHFLWWVEQIILTKKNFLAQIEISTNFHHFCKVRACHIPSKIQFSKKYLKCGETLPLMSGTNNFDKKYFLSTNWNKTNFHHFLSARVYIPLKFQFSKICLKLWRNTCFDEWRK